MTKSGKKLKRPKALILPSDNASLEKFSLENREKMYFHTVNCIEYAIETSQTMVEVFSFVGTQYYVIIHEKDYFFTLEHIFSFFMENEMYENCEKIKKVKEKILLFRKNIKTNCLN